MAPPFDALQADQANALTEADRLAIVNQAILLLEGFYVHLPLKRAMHAVDPLQRLRLLRHRLGQLGDDTRFHAAMTAIFTSVRDLHTNYMLPPPYKRATAALPFIVEDCVEDGELRYIVSITDGAMPDATFEKGVTITHWNGVPIDRAVANAADRHAGSNPAARHSRGLAGLTHRPLIVAPLPDEEWVVVDYVGLDGNARQVRFDWGLREAAAGAGGADAADLGEVAMVLGFDIETVAIQSAREAQFAPKAKEEEEAMLAVGGDPLELVAGTESILPRVFTARAVETASGTFGYIRIRTFMHRNHRQFVDEFARLIRLMPKNGLIIDVRDNGGGVVYCGERSLQLLTPHEIEPERVQFINTASTEGLVKAQPSLSSWVPSVSRAVETGAAFSCAFPITPPEWCNDIGQCYYGPVIMITNARCYSTTDIFAAGFQDHGIGDVLGVDDNTGAGGANVWTHSDLLTLVAADSLLRPLPKGVGMRVAMRRNLRVRKQAGTELEDLGVVPDKPLYSMTRRDLLDGNADLIEAAGARLATKTSFRLDAIATPEAGTLRVDVTTDGLDRLDFAIDGRPQRSEDIADGARRFDLPTALPGGVLLLKGYRAGELAAARRVPF